MINVAPPADLRRKGAELCLRFFLFTGIGAFLFGCGSAPDEEVVQVVNAVIAAHGGMENFKSIETVVRQAAVKTREQEEYLSGEIIKFPGKLRWERQRPAGSFVEAWDSEKAWGDPSGRGEPRIVDEEKAYRIKDRLTSQLAFFVFNFPERLCKLSLQKGGGGKVVLERREGNFIYRYHIDGKTKRIARREVHGHFEKLPVDVIVDYSDYIEMDGLFIPLHCTIDEGAGVSYEEVVCDLEFNRPFPDAIFDNFRYSVVSRESQKAIREGESRLEMQDVEGAIEHYRDSVKRLPHSSRLWLYLGRSCLKGGKWEEALQCFQTAADRGELGPFVFEGRGEALLHLKRRDEAITAFTSALRFPLPAPGADYYLALILQEAGEYSEAVEHLLAVLNFNYKTAEVLYSLGLLYFEKLEDQGRAKFCFQNLLQVSKNEEHRKEAERILKEIENNSPTADE